MIKQPGSKMCFVCGSDNPTGLHLDFWMDDEQVWTEFTPSEEHQGWPGVLHGGLAAAVLDETMGRAAALKDQWMVTAKIEFTYRKPVPLGLLLKVTARIEKWQSGRMMASGQLLLPDGTVAVEGRGLYVRLPEEHKQEFLHALSAQGLDASIYK